MGTGVPEEAMVTNAALGIGVEDEAADVAVERRRRGCPDEAAVSA